MVLIGYHVSHTVTAKVRDLDKAGTTIEAAVEAGATNVQNVSFGLEDPGTAVNQARELAVANARAKAEDLARLTDATLGMVVSISEHSSGTTSPVAYDMRNAEVAASAAPPINAGQTEVVLSVTVTYELK